MNEPVSPKEVETEKTVLVGGLADEKRLRENEQALDAAYEDADDADAPFLKRMRKKFTEAEGGPRGRSDGSRKLP